MRYVNFDGTSVDVATRSLLSLQQMVDVLAADQARTTALNGLLINGGWLTGQFAAVLDQFRKILNDGTHGIRIDRKTATHRRNQLLGVGCPGHLVELAKVKVRS